MNGHYGIVAPGEYVADVTDMMEHAVAIVEALDDGRRHKYDAEHSYVCAKNIPIKGVPLMGSPLEYEKTVTPLGIFWRLV